MNTLTNIATNSVPGFLEDLTLVRIPPWWQNPWFVALLLVLLVLATIVGRRLYARWSHRRPAAATTVAVAGEPPESIALRKLAELRQKFASISAYDFTTECSQILRQYIGARFELPIVFQTTREFLGHAQTSPVLGAEHRETLGNYLQHADRVKFGQHDMTREHMGQMLEYAERFVKAGASRGAATEARR